METYIELLNDGLISLKEAAKRLHMSEEDLAEYRDKGQNELP